MNAGAQSWRDIDQRVNGRRRGPGDRATEGTDDDAPDDGPGAGPLPRRSSTVERDGVEQPFFAGMWGIFGHGNVTGLGQALEETGVRSALLSPSERAGDGPCRRSPTPR